MRNYFLDNFNKNNLRTTMILVKSSSCSYELKHLYNFCLHDERHFHEIFLFYRYLDENLKPFILLLKLGVWMERIALKKCLHKLNGAGASRESIVKFPTRLFTRHDAVDLSKLRWQSLFL